MTYKPTPPFFTQIARLWRHLGLRRRWQFGFLLIVVLLASVSEIISIGAILPFLAALSSPEEVYNHFIAQTLVQLFGLADSRELLLVLTILFALSAVLAGVMRLALLYISTRLSFSVGADLGISIYHRTLYQPYAVHVGRNSSVIIAGITKKANSLVGNVLMPIMTLVSSVLIMIAILVTLVIINPSISLAILVGLGTVYALFIRVTHRRLQVNGKRIAHETTLVVKSLQEGLGGIRDVLIDGSQETYCRIFRDANLPLHRAQGTNKFIVESPRYAIEAIAIVLISVLAYILTSGSQGIATTIPTLGALALGAQRLLPVAQQGYASLSLIRSGQAILSDSLQLLDQPLPGYAGLPAPVPVPFRRDIVLGNLSFRYGPDTPWVLRGVDFRIARGSRIGLIGSTGSGKSTLLDVIMGLLEPTEGVLAIDGQPVTRDNHRSWQARIAHVPQAIYLADTTIEENIAFGIDKDRIDHERVRAAARQAQLADLIEGWPGQYRTFVGEHGIRLSGGQRQRIGIARALYKQADVIIFDEATSALDSETEKAVMRAIDNLGRELTLLIATHRVNTLVNCDDVFEIRNGKIVKVDDNGRLLQRASPPLSDK